MILLCWFALWMNMWRCVSHVRSTATNAHIIWVSGRIESSPPRAWNPVTGIQGVEHWVESSMIAHIDRKGVVKQLPKLESVFSFANRIMCPILYAWKIHLTRYTQAVGHLGQAYLAISRDTMPKRSIWSCYRGMIQVTLQRTLRSPLILQSAWFEYIDPHHLHVESTFMAS